MRPRFHVPDFDPASELVSLPADEAAHLVRVLRLGAGADVEIFDGRGRLWRAAVVEAGKRGATVRPLEPGVPAPETRVRTVLAAAVLKGDKTDDVVRDAVMLGVDAIQPLVTSRTEIALAALARGRRMERWQRVAVASVKQCGRAVVPPVLEPQTFEHYLAVGGAGTRIMCVEPSAATGRVVTVRDVPAPVSAHVVVGPEGGWAADEVEAAAEARWVLVSLGARTLRADAVPLVALSALLAMWSEL